MTSLEIFRNAPEGASPNELAAYLDEACGDDTELRARVDELFARTEPGDDFLERPPLDGKAEESGEPVQTDKETGSGSGPKKGTRKKRRAAPFPIPSVEDVNSALPGFEVQELLGSGGMGAVFKARQEHLKRVVAVKILPPNLGEEVHYVERFKREAQAMAQLSHPNIVTVFDFGTVPSGFHFIVMEFVRGRNLSAVIADRTVTAQQCLHWIRQVCDALAYAHAQGIIHRDIKPANILIDRNANVKVADFGLAKLVDPLGKHSNLTMPDATLGTPDYMAPEALESSAAVDHRADIYAIGVLLYQILTGVLPRGSWELPSKLADVDGRFDRIVDRAMKPTPLDRYQEASDISTELEAIEKTPAWKTGPGRRRVRLKFPGSGDPRDSRPAPSEPDQSNLPVAVVVKPRRWRVVLILLSIAVIAIGLFLFFDAETNAARENLKRLASQEAPQGGVKEVEQALKILNSEKSSPEEKSQAAAVLSKLEGKGVDEAILKALEDSGSPYSRWKLSGVLANRDYRIAVPAMMTAFKRSESGHMRSDILNSVRRIAGLENAEALLETLATPLDLIDRAQLESILLAIYRKQPAESDLTGPLLARVSKAATGEERLSLFRILGALGSEQMLVRLKAVFDQENDRSLRIEALVAYLSWPDRSALEQLEALVTDGARGDNLVRIKAIEAYARLANLPAAIPTEEKITTWKKALGWSKNVKDFHSIFAGIADNPSAETLAFAREHEKEESRTLSGMAKQAAAAIDKLTKQAPVLDDGGRLDSIQAIIRGKIQGASLRSSIDARGRPDSRPLSILGNWKSPETWFVWHFKVKDAGNYGVEFIQADDNDNPSEFQVIIGDQALNGKSKQTQSRNDFEAVALDGTVSLEAGKVHTLFLRAHGVIQPQMMDIEAVHVVKK